MRRVSNTVAVMFAAGMLLSSLGARAEKPRAAKDILSDASTAAKAKHKPILVLFGASWCGWCHKLDGVLETKEYKKLFEDTFIMVKLDVLENADKKAPLENPGGVELMAELGGEKSGLPFYAILDENGKKICDSNAMPGNQNIGYPGEPAEIAAFEGMLKKGAPKMKAADRNGLIAHLKKVAPPPPTPR